MTKVDDEYCTHISSEILLCKLMRKPQDVIPAIVKKGNIIIPLTPEQSEKPIKYVKKVLQFGYILPHKYILKEMNLEKGMHISIFHNKNFWILKKDPCSDEIIDEFGYVLLPEGLRESEYVEFEIKNGQLILKSCDE